MSANEKPDEMVAKLREHAKQNPSFLSMCKLFAKRSRARDQATLTNLTVTLAAQKLPFSPNELTNALEFMAGLGIGKLEKDAGGNVVALVGITFTLQSIGRCVITKSSNLDVFKQSKRTVQKKYKKLRQIATVTSAANSAGTKTTGTRTHEVRAVSIPADAKVEAPHGALTGEMNGTRIILPLPGPLNAERLTELINIIYKQ